MKAMMRKANGATVGAMSVADGGSGRVVRLAYSWSRGGALHGLSFYRRFLAVLSAV